MSHDPFCLAPKCDYDSPDGDCFGYEDCWHRCECILISKVRADERQQAAQRVLDTWEAGALLVCEYPHHMLAEAAIAAARGGEQA